MKPNVLLRVACLFVCAVLSASPAFAGFAGTETYLAAIGNPQGAGRRPVLLGRLGHRRERLARDVHVSVPSGRPGEPEPGVLFRHAVAGSDETVQRRRGDSAAPDECQRRGPHSFERRDLRLRTNLQPAGRRSAFPDGGPVLLGHPEGLFDRSRAVGDPAGRLSRLRPRFSLQLRAARDLRAARARCTCRRSTARGRSSERRTFR